MLPETPGFVAAMDASGPWTPVGIALAMTEPNGPVEHAFFVELLDTIERRLTAAMPVDAVYICSHGAGLTTEEDDPDGVLFELVRDIVGPDVPIAATLDLHANVSERMVQSIDAFIGYRTNPHLDMRERGAEAAAAIREMLAGVKPQRAFIRLPIVPPTVTMLTAAGPYAEMIDFGQQPDDPGDHERLGDGRVCLCRHRQKRADRGRDRAPRQARRRDARPRNRRTRLGQPGAFLSAADLARRGGGEGARGRARPLAAGARLCRRRRQPGRRRARQHDLSAARLYEAGVGGALLGVVFRPRSRRRGAPPRGRRRVRGAVQPIGDYQVLRALGRPGDGRRADRRQMRRPARHLRRDAARARALRRARGRRASRSSSSRTACNAPTRSFSR